MLYTRLVNSYRKYIAELRTENGKIIVNLLVISFSFMLHFTAVTGTSNFQSTRHESIGAFTLLSMQVATLFSNIFLSVPVISLLGCKLTMCVCMLCYMPYIIAQLQPKPVVLISTAILAGLAAAPLLAAKCTYLTVIAERYTLGHLRQWDKPRRKSSFMRGTPVTEWMEDGRPRTKSVTMHLEQLGDEEAVDPVSKSTAQSVITLVDAPLDEPVESAMETSVDKSLNVALHGWTSWYLWISWYIRTYLLNIAGRFIPASLILTDNPINVPVNETAVNSADMHMPADESRKSILHVGESLVKSINLSVHITPAADNPSDDPVVEPVLNEPNTKPRKSIMLVTDSVNRPKHSSPTMKWDPQMEKADDQPMDEPVTKPVSKNLEEQENEDARMLSTDTDIVQFFSVYYVFRHLAQLWGSLISSSVMHSNATSLVSKACGAQFCLTEQTDYATSIGQPLANADLLVWIFLLCIGGAALLLHFAIDPLSRFDQSGRRGFHNQRCLSLVAIAGRQLFTTKQLLIMPITIFVGASFAFMTADFTQSFVACDWGTVNIGYAMTFYGVAKSLTSAASGAISNWIGRAPVMAGTMLTHLYLLTWLHEHIPAGQYMRYCVMSSLWGLVDGVWDVEINSYYAVLFPDMEEVAFSNFQLFLVLGTIGNYLCSPFVCTGNQIVWLGTLMVLGMAGFWMTENIRRQEWIREKLFG